MSQVGLTSFPKGVGFKKENDFAPGSYSNEEVTRAQGTLGWLKILIQRGDLVLSDSTACPDMQTHAQLRPTAAAEAPFCLRLRAIEYQRLRVGQWNPKAS